MKKILIVNESDNTVFGGWIYNTSSVAPHKTINWVPISDDCISVYLFNEAVVNETLHCVHFVCETKNKVIKKVDVNIPTTQQ